MSTIYALAPWLLIVGFFIYLISSASKSEVGGGVGAVLMVLSFVFIVMKIRFDGKQNKDRERRTSTIVAEVTSASQTWYMTDRCVQSFALKGDICAFEVSCMRYPDLITALVPGEVVQVKRVESKAGGICELLEFKNLSRMVERAHAYAAASAAANAEVLPTD